MEQRKYGTSKLRRFTAQILATGLVAGAAMVPAVSHAFVDSKTSLVNLRSLTAPRKGASVTDPTFGVSVKRLTDRGQNGGMATAEYPQLQAFNANETKILITTNSGRDIIDLNGTVLYSNLSLVLPRWHPTNPNTLYAFNAQSGGTIYLQRITLGSAGTITRTNLVNVTALGYSTIDSGCWEDFSATGRYTALLDQAKTKVSVLDVTYRRLSSTVQLHADVDWVAVSPSARYLLVQYASRGTGPNQGLVVYLASNGSYVGHATEHYDHGDIGKDESGFDVFGTMAYTDECANGSVACMSVSPLPNAIEQGSRNHLVQMPAGIGSYTSCRNHKNGGFCVNADDAGSRAGIAPYAKEIWLTRMYDGATRRLFHHRSSSCGYFNLSRPTISPSGRYVAFSSDWARPNCSGQSDTYLIDLASALPGWAPLVP
jgi:hypothetical protein